MSRALSIFGVLCWLIDYMSYEGVLYRLLEGLGSWVVRWLVDSAVKALFCRMFSWLIGCFYFHLPWYTCSGLFCISLESVVSVSLKLVLVVVCLSSSSGLLTGWFVIDGLIY